MSFLANLRVQCPEKQSLRLCYVLEHDAISDQLQLFLYLYNPAQGPIKLATPYLLTRAHLQKPPAFISDIDLGILQTFIGLQSNWPIGELTATITLCWLLLEPVIKTGRCYYRHQNQLKPVSIGNEQSVQPYWCLDHSARYRLYWRFSHEIEGSSKAHCLPLENELLYRQIENDSVVLGRATEAITLLKNAAAGSPRKYWELHSLRLAVNADTDQLDGLILPLPLPKPPPTHVLNGQLQWLLLCEPLCESGDTDGGLFSLCFSVGDNKYCSLPQKATDNIARSRTYWDGDCFYQLDVDNEYYQQTKQCLSEQLDSIVQREPSAYQWQAQGEEQCQRLFMERLLIERLPMERLPMESCASPQARALEFVIHPAFKYRYVFCTGWQVGIQETDNNDLQLLLSPQFQSDTISLNTISLHSILNQLQSYNRQQQCEEQENPLKVTLNDGRTLLLPKRETLRLMEELVDLDFDSGGFYLDRAQGHRLASLDRVLGGQAQWHGDLRALQQAINVRQSPIVLDSNCSFVNAELRPYQWLGVCWIYHLKQQGVNGLLADDMGLGKTLQAISLLAFEKQQGVLKKPALIVLPLSLLYNWVNELEKFVPQLNVCVVHGNKRHKEWAGLLKKDVLLTTYQSLAIDLEYWREQPLSWLILDEAQMIKNPNTRWAQALRDIVCDNRLCLSGTPVENHLGELWSIMDFLMPGCLGSQSHFRHTFRKTIEEEGNGQRLVQLLDWVAPFMLRRTKDQIAKDLPLKTEIIQHIPLGAAQREFYNTLKYDTLKELQCQFAESEHSGQHRIAALTALLKLRQACCDPALFEGITLSSAKKTYCVAMVDELVAEGRAVLVFSQFTEMLKLLKAELQQRQIKSLMLTGKTQDRQALVDAFQQGAAPVFLISLKAGGIGLNLTRADTVIHYDPWWNAAAEKQASDRVHRIGQDKPVFVYKLIAADTIEEKISILQQQKALLTDHVDQQASTNADNFSLKFEELLSFLQEEMTQEDIHKRNNRRNI